MNTEEMKIALATGMLVKWQGPFEYSTAVGTLTEIVTYFDQGFKISATVRDNGGRIYHCRPNELSFWRPVKEEAHSDESSNTARL